MTQADNGVPLAVGIVYGSIVKSAGFIRLISLMNLITMQTESKLSFFINLVEKQKPSDWISLSNLNLNCMLKLTVNGAYCTVC